jgi:hypothetical protein
LLTTSAFAQTSRGTITGVVTDATLAGVPNATVNLIDQERNTTRSTQSNESGLYRFDAVDPGNYVLEVKKEGFQTFKASAFTVAAAQVVNLDAKMEVGSQATVVEVSAESTLLQVEQPVRGATIAGPQRTELPVAGRNPVALALTVPGVSTNRGGTGVGTFSVNGGRGRSNNFLLDGTENNDISVNGQAFQVTNQDAVQEVSIQTSNYDAEFGRAGGAVVNTIVKSGTNEFRGSATYLLESTRFNAITSTQALSSYVQQNNKPIPGTEQWFSGALGGPIKKNRTFFFGAWQERRRQNQATVNLITLSQAGRNTLRQLSPQGRNAHVDLFLDATQGAVANTQLSNVAMGLGRPDVQTGTVIRTLPVKFDNRQPIVKIDHRLTDKDSIMGRFALDDQNFPFGASNNFPGFDTSQRNRYQNAVVTWTRVISPSMTNEFRLPYNRITLDFPNDGTSPVAQTLPSLQIQGLTAVGVATNIPQGRIANNYGLQETISIVRGRHSFRFGADLLLQRARQFAPFSPRGIVNWNASNVAGQNFQGLANFLDNFGGTATVSRDFGSPAYYPNLFRQAYFFQDRWRMSNDLTVTLGVRYEYFGLPMNSLRTPGFEGLFNINPTTFEGPYSQPNRINGDKNNFAPTIGLAWNPSMKGGLLGWLMGDKKFTLRAGYQLGFESFFNNIASNAQASTPNLISTNLNSVPSAAEPRGTGNWFAQIPLTARAPNPLDSQTLILKDLVNPYYQRFNATIQRQLPKDILFEMGYVGSRGVKLFATEDLNPLVPLNFRIFPQGTSAANFPASRLQQRFDPLQGVRSIRTNGASSTYHSLQFDVRRRFKNGFLVNGAYTWSKNIDIASDVFAWGGGLNIPATTMRPSIFGGIPLDRALSAFDRPHRAVFSYVYELPLFKKQQGVAGKILGGWQLAGITTFESGVPYTISNGLDADGFGGAGTDRPDFNPNGRPGVRAQISATSPTGYVNPEQLGADGRPVPIAAADAMFIQLPTCTNAAGCRSGNLGRNTQRSPGINNFDVNLQKNTRINERFQVQFRTEFFNIFNHVQYGVATASAFAPGVGTLGANMQSTLNGRFLRPEFQDGGGRVVRFQLKLLF